MLQANFVNARIVLACSSWHASPKVGREGGKRKSHQGRQQNLQCWNPYLTMEGEPIYGSSCRCRCACECNTAIFVRILGYISVFHIWSRSLFYFKKMTFPNSYPIIYCISYESLTCGILEKKFIAFNLFPIFNPAKSVQGYIQ